MDNKQEKITIIKSKLILCEGIEDQLFIQALIGHENIAGLQIIQYEGKGKLRNFLQTLPKIPGFNNVTSIGITRDADNEQIDDIFKSICSALKNAELPVPPGVNVTTLQNDSHRVSIFIFPDCKNSGMLENLCFTSIPKHEQNCISKFKKCISEARNGSDINSKKADIYAWLSMHDDPLKLGQAARNGLFNFADPAFDLFKTFILAL